MKDFLTYYLTQGFTWNCLWYPLMILGVIFVAHIVCYLIDRCQDPIFDGTKIFGFEWISRGGLFLTVWVILAHVLWVLANWLGFV